MVAQAYQQGVPMGGELMANQIDATKLRFLVSAQKDAGTARSAGTDIQRIQIIKGWVDADGQTHEQVFDVAGSADNGASVDPRNCDRLGKGHRQLCTVWQDPDFNPEEKAFYYVRVLEIPTPRWVLYDKVRLGAEIPEGTELVHQERAYTSPIWYNP